MFTNIYTPDESLWAVLAAELQNELNKIVLRDGRGRTFVRKPGVHGKRLVSNGGQK